jgi:hypothetical protein
VQTNINIFEWMQWSVMRRVKVYIELNISRHVFKWNFFILVCGSIEIIMFFCFKYPLLQVTLDIHSVVDYLVCRLSLRMFVCVCVCACARSVYV